MTTESTPDWRLHGVRIVRSDELDLNTPQTPGMTRAAAITHASAGANKLWRVPSRYTLTSKPVPITTENWRA